MGGKRPATGKHLHLCVAILIFLSPVACSLSNTVTTETVDPAGDEARGHLVLGKAFLARGEYANALMENEKALSLAGKNSPGDEALFHAGLIYAHPANTARNYAKSLASFRRLLRDYPASPLVAQAKVVAALLQENDRLDRTTDKLNKTIEEQKKALERLNKIIDELKQVDIDTAEKKRERAK